MPRAKRHQVAPTEEWTQLRLFVRSPEQELYEAVRPIVLFGRSVAVRARETGIAERTLRRKADAFDRDGMASLFAHLPDPSPGPREDDRRALPARMRQVIVDLAAEHPAFRPHEIATISFVRFGRKPSPHTVQRVLAQGPRPSRSGRRYPPYAQIAEPAERRLAIIRLHSEGWNSKSIAAYLQISRETVHATLRRWVAEGVAGLEDKPHRNRTRVRKDTLATHEAVRKLQENPELGEFRIHAALKQLGIHLSPRTCGRILALNRQLYRLPRPTRAPREAKAMPFRAERRHQYWRVDIRYSDHHLDEGRVYCISILENYSRAVLASALSRTQDLTAYLIVLYAAIRQHGTPEALVSDGGTVFKAKQALAIYAAPGIRKEQIEKRQAWQSYIETQFNVQRRMADYHFARAQTWPALLAVHDRWIADFNYQVHWAHRDRQDQRHSPAEVLGWVSGTLRAPDHLERIFCATRFGRQLDRAGYVRFRHWRLYGELGLSGKRAAVWLYKETLTIEFAEEPLSQFAVDYQPDKKHLRHVTNPRRFETRYQSPQMSLWPEGEVEWHLVRRGPEYASRPRASPTPTVKQLSLALYQADA
jgi:transposase